MFWALPSATLLIIYLHESSLIFSIVYIHYISFINALHRVIVFFIKVAAENSAANVFQVILESKMKK